MRMLELPLLRAENCIAVTLERTAIANCPMFVVTVREAVGSPPRRRWYADEVAALAYAAEQADRHGLLLIDLRDPED